MKLTMTVQSTDQYSSERTSRSFGNINRSYVSYTESSSTPKPVVALPYNSGTQYSSFMAWADAVARGLMSLSDNTYYDASIAATWGVTEELNA